MILAISLLAAGVSSLGAEAFKSQPAHHLARGFRNLDTGYDFSVPERARRLMRRVLFEGWPKRGSAPAVLANDGASLRANGQTATVTLIGHATLLLQLDGVNILTDPHWG